MSTAEIIAEIDHLPGPEREVVLDHFLRLRQEELPPHLTRSIADALAGRGYDMERVMSGEAPPPARE